MARASSGVALFFLTMVLAIGCARPIDPIGASCGDDRDCSAGEICSGGICASGGVTTCITDLDCDPAAGQVCSSGICAAPRESGGEACTATADCPIDTFCNTAQGLCAPLLEGWCRKDTQCSEASPFCSNAEQGEAVPGRCVECLADADCDGGTCQSPGICAIDNACPDNASPVVGGTCRCNVGFIDDGAGGCASNGDTGQNGPEDPVDPVDPGPTPTTPGTGEPCASEGECYEAVGFEYTCSDQGECVCDIAFLEIVCDGAVDESICDCAGGSSSSGEPALDAECFEDLDCDVGLTCIFSASAGLLDPGVCKLECAADTDCTDVGLECMEDVLDVGVGICADVQQRGETCETSVYADDLAGEQMCDGSGTAILDCFSARCEQICDWQGRTGQRPTCASGTTCGSLQFRAEAGTSVAVCQ